MSQNNRTTIDDLTDQSPTAMHDDGLDTVAGGQWRIQRRGNVRQLADRAQVATRSAAQLENRVSLQLGRNASQVAVESTCTDCGDCDCD